MTTLEEFRAAMANYSLEVEPPAKRTDRLVLLEAGEHRARGVALLCSAHDARIPSAKFTKLRDIDMPGIVAWQTLPRGDGEVEVIFEATATATCDYIAHFAFIPGVAVWDSEVLAVVQLPTPVQLVPGVTLVLDVALV